jgi:hypothetical protein
MRRVEFLRACLFTGLAGAVGITTSGAEELPADLHEALSEIGVRKLSSSLTGGVLRIRCQVTDFDALSRKAGALGNGNVRVARNTLSFVRKGQRMELELIA